MRDNRRPSRGAGCDTPATAERSGQRPREPEPPSFNAGFAEAGCPPDKRSARLHRRASSSYGIFVPNRIDRFRTRSRTAIFVASQHQTWSMRGNGVRVETRTFRDRRPDATFLPIVADTKRCYPSGGRQGPFPMPAPLKAAHLRKLPSRLTRTATARP